MTTTHSPQPASLAVHSHRALAPETPPGLRVAGIVVGLLVALAIIFIAFALPAARSKPHDIPIGVAGPPAAATQLSVQLGQNAPDAFAVTGYGDEDALRTAIGNRDVYGGFVMGADGPTLLLASGGSPIVAQLLTQIGGAMAQHTGAPLRTEDLAPLPSADPRGSGLAASAFPLTMAGLVPVYVLVLVFKREVWLRFAATVVFSGAVALMVASILRYLFSSIDQNFWGVTGGLFLGALAMSLSVLGLGSIFGKAGLAIGAIIAMLLGNPLSGLSSAPEMLPRGWGAFGQFLPQGANATLLRSTAYFDGAGAGSAIIVLSCWALAGAVMIVVAGLRRRDA